MKRIRVVVVDDSALMRKFLRETLSSDPAIEVVGAAHDPFIARDMIRRLNPDVLTLDIMMPGLDGLTFLERIMKLRPLPVVMFSSLPREGSEPGINALSIGAFDFIEKPQDESNEAWQDVGQKLIAQIKSASLAHVQPTTLSSPACASGSSGATITPLAAQTPAQRTTVATRWPRSRLVAIGSSTGGVQALRSIVSELPGDIPPIVIVQHMPATFTKSFANRLNQIARARAIEAYDQCEILAGHIYVAPGDQHLTIEQRDHKLYCRLHHGPEVNGHTPSIDVLFKSIAKLALRHAMGIILTGMGRDGALGLKDIHDIGGVTAAQDQATSLIFGMPKAAIEIGAAQHELALEQIADFIVSPSPAGSSLSKPAVATRFVS